jgi:hypothetical protein
MTSHRKMRHVKSVALGSTAILSSFFFQTQFAVADNLAQLKAELEGLRYEVGELKKQTAANTHQIRTVNPRRTTRSGRPLGDNEVVIGNNIVAFDRGSRVQGKGFEHLVPRRDLEPDGRGFTFAISPVADLPGPVHEITISGYVKGDVIYDFDQNLGDAFGATNLRNRGKNPHVRLHARQSRFRIKSKSSTSIGEIRTYIETDFFGSGNSTLRLRHAWGEWDMSPNWTLGVGQTWSNFMPLLDLADTIDFSGPVGVAFSRQAQVRLTYKSGPLQIAVAVEDPAVSLTAGGVPVGDAAEQVPDFTGRIVYSLPGGNKLALTGVIGEQRIDPDAGPGIAGGNASAMFWGLIGVGQINVADAATVTLSGGIGKGAGRYVIGADVANNVFNLAVNPAIRTRQYYHFAPNVNFRLTETVSTNLAWGYMKFRNANTRVGQTKHVTTIHGNLIWRPVEQLKMGVETMWGKRKIKGGGSPDAVRAQFGAWFFF